MTHSLTLAALMLVFVQTHAFQGPGRDPCKITDEGFGLTCSNITSTFFTSPMFLSLNDDIAQFTGEVKRFEIQQSKITNFSTASFKHMPQLSYLIASNISLTDMDRGAFEGLQNLKMVDLSWNNLKEMPVRAFKDTPISFLSLEGNRGIAIPTNGPIIEAKRLRSLILKRCEILHFPGSAFTEVLGLEYLDLSYNRLEMLPKAVLSPLQHLDFINLSGNRFTTIDFDIFKSVPSYPNLPRSVILEGNPWFCDCRISHLIRWVTQNGSTWTNVATMSRLKKRTHCHAPENLHGISWNDSRLGQLLSCKR